MLEASIGPLLLLQINKNHAGEIIRTLKFITHLLIWIPDTAGGGWPMPH